MTSAPLHRYPGIRTSQIEAFEHQLNTVYGAIGFDVGDISRLRVQANFLQLSDVALGYVETGAWLAVHFGETDDTRLQLVQRGQGVTTIGRATATVTPGRPVLKSPGQRASFKYSEDFQQLFLRVKSEALRQKLTSLLGLPVRQPIEFALADFADRELLAGLEQLILRFVQLLDNEYSLLSPLALKEIEQAIVVQLLFASRHRWSALLAREPLAGTEAQLKRVEEYIAANCNQPMTIESLSEVAGISIRSLFRSFEKTRGCSPMVFVKKTRLERARTILEHPAETTTVTGVAFACGFSNLGHFANDYRRLFGERPSDTLKRAGVRT